MPTDKERYVIVVQAEGTDGPPVIIRLRRLLECMLRSFGIRVVSIRPETPPELPTSPRNEPSTPAVDAVQPIANDPGKPL